MLKELALWPSEAAQQPRGNTRADPGLGSSPEPTLLEQTKTCLLLSLKLYISYFGPYPVLQALLHDQVQNSFSLKEKQLRNSFLWRVN